MKKHYVVATINGFELRTRKPKEAGIAFITYTNRKEAKEFWLKMKTEQ